MLDGSTDRKGQVICLSFVSSGGPDLIAAMMLLLARVVDLREGGDAHPALRSPYSVSAQAALSAPRP